MQKENKGCIYILTNPSFKEYVKIGYADDVESRVKILNNSSATPFAFRIYATYDVNERLEDKEIHRIIDTINPELRSTDDLDGKKRTREFFAMSKEDAYTLFSSIAEISGTQDRLHKWAATEKEKMEESIAEENIELNRHHFKEIEFSSSLTGKRYRTETNSKGTLSIFEVESNEEILNNSHPSKKQIVGVALEDLGQHIDKDDSLYQRVHRLTKIILKNK